MDNLIPFFNEEEKKLWSRYKEYNDYYSHTELDPERGTLDDPLNHYRNIDPSGSLNRQSSDFMLHETYHQLKRKGKLRLSKLHLDKWLNHRYSSE